MNILSYASPLGWGVLRKIATLLIVFVAFTVLSISWVMSFIVADKNEEFSDD